MMATAYAKSANGDPVVVQPLDGGLASPGDPLRGETAAFHQAAVLNAGRLQASFLNIKRRESRRWAAAHRGDASAQCLRGA